jgi:F-type H+-transporting ATPase subunit c
LIQPISRKEEFGVNKRIIMMALIALVAVSAFAQGTEAQPAASGVRWGIVSAAFVLGIAAAFGALGQGKAIAASVEGIARNPSAGAAIRGAMIIGLALIESLVIYALVIAFIMVFAK